MTNLPFDVILSAAKDDIARQDCAPGPEILRCAQGDWLKGLFHATLCMAYLLRRTFLSNLPTLVFGMASTKITSSGSHHFATFGRRYSIISSFVIESA